MSLRVWLPLNGNLHNLGISNHKIALTEGNTWTSPGKIGTNTLALTKLLLIVPSTSCMSGAKEISYAYWIKVNTVWSANWLDGIRWIETDGSATSTARQEFYTNCTLIGTWYNGGAINGKAFTPGVWTHLAGTFNYNTGEAKFYINGVLSGSTTNINTAYYCRGDFCIGDNGVDMCENDVRIYDHCLSAAEVKEIAKGLILHYKLDNYANPNLLTGNVNSLTSWIADGTTKEYDDNALKITDEGTGNRRIYNSVQENTYNAIDETFTVSFDARAAADGTIINCSRSIVATDSVDVTLSTEWLHYSEQFTISATATGGTLSIQSKTTDAIFWIRNIKLEHGACETPFILPGKEISIIEDSSGYNHNGICVDTIVSNDNPRYDTCISCIGTTVDNSSNTIDGAQFFYCNMDMPATNAITIAWWNKIMQYGRGGIFETSSTILTNTTKGTDYNTTAFANWDSTFGVYNGSTRVNIFSNFARNGEWHHHAITFDGVNVKYYLDGILKLTSALTGSLPAWKSFCIGLGKAGGVWRQIQLDVSDFRIYCTPLSVDDIKQLYSVPVKIDNLGDVYAYEFVEGERIQEDGIDISGTNTITMSNTTSTSNHTINLTSYTDYWYTLNNHGSWSVAHHQTHGITGTVYDTISTGTFPIKNNMEFTITCPVMGSYQPIRYLYRKKTAKSSSPGYTFSLYYYGYYGQYNIMLNLYNNEDVLVNTITIKNLTSSGSLSSSSATPAKLSITACTYNGNTFNSPYEISYGKIQLERCGTLSGGGSKTITLTNKKQFPDLHHQITIDQQGQLYELEINEVDFNTNAQFKKDGTVLAREFIER